MTGRLNNWGEWRAGTDPTNDLSVLKLLSASPAAPGATVRWQSVADVTYFLERSSDLSATPAFSAIQSNIVGVPDTTAVTDPSASGAGPCYYRVGVQ